MGCRGVGCRGGGWGVRGVEGWGVRGVEGWGVEGVGGVYGV